MSDAIFTKIQAQIDANPVMLFMKGDRMFPQCGFSQRVVQILDHLHVPYQTANVLESAELRQGIKDFSQWPTVPQLYVKGEFIGGCDIVTAMFQSGELEALFSEKGIAATAA
ncbi:Grx4 family monothiol glutaredoxin [Tanticharoenia sakaeratensis]|uniref:Glutaredoxin n=1 Tax=Tanticharoenia sakaeratensis NBRC 103193 TaxID=1231623 RepID=A0A0D6MIR1_9PROT|nr:Grx4 family monothiol glutaredoxin [Tanticharoenia sakaeratensis]GAN53371.1 glutaredoxin [Tanticharoenia sakaeratensis NBRC 103193]GBQ20842.1 glutaredoxin [Tanticharoenia sakaeratensis NBRC 103193]